MLWFYRIVPDSQTKLISISSVSDISKPKVMIYLAGIAAIVYDINILVNFPDNVSEFTAISDKF